MTNRTWMMAALASAIMAGCGGSGPNLVPVEGTVTHNGKPLEGAEVTFIPDGANAGGLAGTGVTGPAGDYYAMTRNRTGLVPGKYQVTVKRVKVDESAAADTVKGIPAPILLELEQNYAVQSAQKTGKKVGLPDHIELVEGTFERDVPPEGGVVDFVVGSQRRNAQVSRK